MTKLYPIRITEELEKTLKFFQESLATNEEIVSTAVQNDWLIVTTRVVEKVESKDRNLLLEELRSRPAELIKLK